LRGSGRFPPPHGGARAEAEGLNPLHCGAVVASIVQTVDERTLIEDSIPFIAGQWSLLNVRPLGPDGRVVTQSPSLRGSGRFVRPLARPPAAHRDSIPFIAGQWSLRPASEEAGQVRGRRLNPLHCGAVVASSRWPATGPAKPSSTQSPSLRGSGRFRGGARVDWAPLPSTQSPSLRGSGRFRGLRRRRPGRKRDSIPFIAGQWSLHFRRCGCGARRRRDSIPFIAGQWSLRTPPPSAEWRTGDGLNPLHCGAVVASSPPPTGWRRRAWTQSPSLRGSGRFAKRKRGKPRSAETQSPSLRGSGRFLGVPNIPHQGQQGLNPLHCGAVVASCASGWPKMTEERLNPLHCGAVVASAAPVSPPRPERPDSIPFIAGQWSLRGTTSTDDLTPTPTQSPSLRGSGRFQKPHGSTSSRYEGLNPLHCGAVVASALARLRSRADDLDSIPFIAGQWSLRVSTKKKAEEEK